jgi:hypothetical protein
MALLAAPLTMSAAAAASDGTISFVGAIRAPSLQMSASRIVFAMPVGAANAHAVRQAAGVALTFNSSPDVVSGADVAVQAVGNAQPREAVAARLVESGGRVAAADDGHYRVSRDGGVLSLAPKRPGADTRAIVVVSYD